jgi:tetratricopeptide (TPR) repeat protein
MSRIKTTTPHSTWSLLCGLLGWLLLSLAPVSAQARKDVISLADGKELSGRIKSEDFAALVVEVKAGQDETVPWGNVKNIEYGTLPELAQALSSFRNGKYADALPAFEEILSDKKVKPVAQQSALYHAAASLHKLGRVDEAIDAYKKLFEAFPKGRYLRLGGEAISSLHVAKGDFTNAGAALDRLGQGASDVAEFKPHLALLKGRVLEMDGKRTANAREAYDAAEKGAGSNATLLQEAQIGKARCLLAEGKYAEAEPIFRALTNGKASATVMAGACNGIGAIYYEDGRSKREAEKLTDAAIWHLKAYAVYAPLPGESTAEYERALFGAARSFKAASEIEKNAERKRQNAERFAKEKERLEKEFPASVYLKEL